MDEIAQQAENITFDVTMAHDHEAAIGIVASALRHEHQMAVNTIDALVAALDEFVVAAKRTGIQHDALRGRVERADAALALARGEV